MSRQALVFRWGCSTWIDEEDVMKGEEIFGWAGTAEPMRINDDLIGATAEPMGHRHAGVWHDEMYTMTYPPDGTRLPQISEETRKTARDSWDAMEYRLTGQRSGKTAMVLQHLEKLDRCHYSPEQISFYGTTTVCKFPDGKYTSARPQKGEKFDKETGVAMCIAKYIYGSRSKFLKAVEKGHQQ